MTIRRLHNDDWGFESNCFVCEPRNTMGLRIPFDHDDVASVVSAEFSLDERFSGAPNYVHGGIVLAILDEAMAWAAIAIGGKFAVTKESTTQFERPVRVGRAHRVEGFVNEAGDVLLSTSAQVLDGKGRRCARTSATFTVLTAAIARDAIGQVGDDHARLLRDTRS